MTGINQIEFDDKYITSTEICLKLGVSRSALHYAKQRGILPGSIVIKGVNSFVWKRDEISENLERWKSTLDNKKGSSK